MANLIYWTNTSLDGYIEDENGNFDWSEPTDELHGFINDMARPVGTHLYGRRLYETMSVWETMGNEPDEPPVIVDFAGIWRGADKVVYSRTLEAVSTAKTRIERDFEPEAVQRLKAEADGDLIVGGAALGAEAFRAGLVDEVHLYVIPILVGGGKRALPDGIRQNLELVDERRFDPGTVFLRYRTV
jgi:dihydrofolate reductase